MHSMPAVLRNFPGMMNCTMPLAKPHTMPAECWHCSRQCMYTCTCTPTNLNRLVLLAMSATFAATSGTLPEVYSRCGSRYYF
jgi:hypothetical protein